MKKIYSITLFLLVNYSLIAQQWLVFGGLPNNSARTAAKDNQNDIWVSTFGGGLSKLVNGGYVNYLSSNSGLTDDYTNCVTTDNQGNKWVGTYNTGAFRYNGTSWMNISTTTGLPGNRINCIEVDKSNNDIWLGINFNGATKYNGSTYVTYRTTNSSLPNNNINAITIDNQGNKWISTMGGLAKLNGSTWTIYSTSTSGIAGNQVYCVTIESPNVIWVGTNNGLCKFDGNNTWIIYDTDNSSLPFNYVNTIAIDSANNKWIGTTQGGMAKFDGNTTWQIFDTNNSDLPGMDVRHIFIDSDDNKWISTNDGGFAFYGVLKTASIEITASSDSMCVGETIVFTASTIEGGGSSPSFQWILNGNNVGTNSNTYSNSALLDTDLVSCVLTSTLPNAVGSPATSNVISLPYRNTIAASVGIVADNDSVCAGTQVVFNATQSGGGSSPVYQWFLNGNVVGNNSATFSTSTLSNADTIVCNMVSSLACASPNTAISNTVSIFVSEIAVPVISQNIDTLFCSENGVIYKWYLDGNLISGANTNYITITENGNYYVEIENELGCNAVSSVFNVIITAFNFTKANMEFAIYPNPVSNGEKLNILVNETIANEKIEIAIYNILGDVVFSNTSVVSTNKIVSLDLGKITSGVYWLELNTSNSKINKKIIVK